MICGKEQEEALLNLADEVGGVYKERNKLEQENAEWKKRFLSHDKLLDERDKKIAELRKQVEELRKENLSLLPRDEYVKNLETVVDGLNRQLAVKDKQLANAIVSKFKIGQEVWVRYEHWRDTRDGQREARLEKTEILSGVLLQINLKENDAQCWIKIKNSSCALGYFHSWVYLKDVFATKAEAEQALAKLKAGAKCHS